MKKCELCKSIAKMYCESDEAMLCWDCDSKVHSANFLVSKHSRILLCRSCQSLTPWSASGPKLSPTLSICHSCVNTSSNFVLGAPSSRNHDDEDDEEEEDEEDDEDEDEEEDEEDNEEDDDDDGDNQVVPLGTVSSSEYFQGRERAKACTNDLLSSIQADHSRFPRNKPGRNQEGGVIKSSSWKWR